MPIRRHPDTDLAANNLLVLDLQEPRDLADIGIELAPLVDRDEQQSDKNKRHRQIDERADDRDALRQDQQQYGEPERDIEALVLGEGGNRGD